MLITGDSQPWPRNISPGTLSSVPNTGRSPLPQLLLLIVKIIQENPSHFRFKKCEPQGGSHDRRSRDTPAYCPNRGGETLVIAQQLKAGKTVVFHDIALGFWVMANPKTYNARKLRSLWRK
jgi:hypothetical protein